MKSFILVSQSAQLSHSMPLYYLQAIVNNALTWQSSCVIANKVKLFVQGEVHDVTLCHQCN